jgi:hypothetical protein
MTDSQIGAGDFHRREEHDLERGSRRHTTRHPRLPQNADPLPRLSSTSRRAAARWWTQVLDGRRVWGSVDVSPTRYGVTRYRLVVFPPGIDSVERRLLRSWRVWPTWGATLWLLSLIVLSAILPPGVGFAMSTVVYLGTGAVLFGRVGALNSQVRILSVVRIGGFSDPQTAAMYTELETLADMLYIADALRDQGRLSATGHEAAWWQVYDRLGHDHPRTGAHAGEEDRSV